MDIFHLGVHEKPFEDGKTLCVGIRGRPEEVRTEEGVNMAQQAARQEGWNPDEWSVQGVGPQFPDGQKGRFFWFQTRETT